MSYLTPALNESAPLALFQSCSSAQTPAKATTRSERPLRQQITQTVRNAPPSRKFRHLEQNCETYRESGATRDQHSIRLVRHPYRADRQAMWPAQRGQSGKREHDSPAKRACIATTTRHRSKSGTPGTGLDSIRANFAKSDIN